MKKSLLIGGFMAIVTAVLLVISCAWGPVKIPFDRVAAILFAGDRTDEVQSIIVLETRMPRALAALLCGIALSCAGWLMQTMFRNPLAGPSVLGITSGSSLGVALLVLAGGGTATALGSFGLVGAALIGALSVLVLILLVSRRLAEPTSLLLFGMMLGFFVSAIVSALQFKASATSLKSFILWGMGSFSEITIGQLGIVVSFLIPILLVMATQLKSLNLLLLGEEYAASLGVHTQRMRLLIVVLVGLLTSIITAFCGPVAFIGLVVPHVARLMVKTAEHRRVFIPLIWTGSAAALLSDLLSRWLEIPLNATLSALGAPIIIYLLLQGQKNRVMI